MRFRLTYEGPLKSSQPQHKSKDGDGNVVDRRVEHKHAIRRQLHKQLKVLWRTNPFLNSIKIAPEPYGASLPPTTAADWQGHDPKQIRAMDAVLGDIFSHHKDYGYRYVPLVWKECRVACSLRVICLRQDHDTAISVGRDIDNRVKTLIDALTMPSRRHGPPLQEQKPLVAASDEMPFYVLLDDDQRVTHLEVETDQLLAPLPEGADESYVRLLISVDIRPTMVTMFNLSFG